MKKLTREIIRNEIMKRKDKTYTTPNYPKLITAKMKELGDLEIAQQKRDEERKGNTTADLGFTFTGEYKVKRKERWDIPILRKEIAKIIEKNLKLMNMNRLMIQEVADAILVEMFKEEK